MAANRPFGGTAEEALDYIRGKLYPTNRYDQQVYAFFVDALQTSDDIAAQLERVNEELAIAAEDDREYQGEGDTIALQAMEPVDHGDPHVVELEQGETEVVFPDDEPDVGDLDDLPPEVV